MLEKRPTLAVMDCQSGFFASGPQRLMRAFSASVANIIRDLARAGRQVVFVEFDGYGETLPTLREAACVGRTRTLTLVKRKDDLLDDEDIGYGENLRVLKPLQKTWIPIELVGVNATACMKRSAHGLLKNGFLPRVLGHGTLNNFQEPADRHYALNDVAYIRWDYYRKFGNKTDLVLDMQGVWKHTNVVDLYLQTH